MKTVRIACVFYSVMGLASLVLIAWRFGFEKIRTDLLTLPQSWIGPGALVVAGVCVTHMFSRWASRRYECIASAADEIRHYLGNLSSVGILLLAVGSGIGEELLFRGWLLPETGLVASSAIFGAIHLPPNRNWLFWPVFAFVIGVALGLLYTWSSHLIWPILLHAGINYFNLHYLLGERSDTRSVALR